MISRTPIILKRIDEKYSSLFECSIANHQLLDNLLTSIVEKSPDMASTPIPKHNIYSNTSQEIVSTKDKLTINEYSQLFYQCMEDYNNTQNYLKKLENHLNALSEILEYLRHNKNLIKLLEPIEIRLVQMNAKRNQINLLVNHSSIKDLIEKTSSFILQSKSIIDSNELLTCTRLSINQTTTLIDHLKNEYRYTKYHLNEYDLKLQHRRDVLIKLTEQIEQFLFQQNRIAQEKESISRNNYLNRQQIELIKLSNEYDRLQNENYLLALQAKENLERLSMIMQSNQH